MLGEVPHDWEPATLSEACAFFTDGDWVESKDQNPDGEVRLIQLADIGDGAFLDKSNRFLTAQKARDLRCSLLERGDLLIARMAEPIARCCLFPGLDQPAATVVDIAIARAREGIDQSFLSYAVSDRSFRELALGAASGTTRSRISRSNLGALPILLPPLDEQRRIAEVLRSVDEAIGLNYRTAQQAECALTSARLHLTGLDGSETGWSRKPVLECFQLQRGHDLPVQNRNDGGVPVIASNGPVGFHDYAPIPSPAVITGRSGTIGKVTYFDGPCWPLNTTLFVRDFKGSDPRFVYHFLSAFPLGRHATGTGVPTLNRNDVHALEVHWPESEEQRRRAKVLDSLEMSWRAAQAAHEACRSLKVKLAADLLSGRVRVPA